MPKIDANTSPYPGPSLPQMIDDVTQKIPGMGDLGREEFYKLKQARQRLNDLIYSPENVSQIEIDKAQNEVKVWERRLEKARNGQSQLSSTEPTKLEKEQAQAAAHARKREGRFEGSAQNADILRKLENRKGESVETNKTLGTKSKDQPMSKVEMQTTVAPEDLTKLSNRELLLMQNKLTEIAIQIGSPSGPKEAKILDQAIEKMQNIKVELSSRPHL